MMQTNAVAGNTIEIQVDVTNRDGTAVSLIGSTLTFRAATIDGSHLITKTSNSGITIDGVVTGRLLVTLDAADTAVFTTPRNLLWDIEMLDALSKTRTIAKGKIALSIPVSALAQ